MEYSSTTQNLAGGRPRLTLTRPQSGSAPEAKIQLDSTTRHYALLPRAVLPGCKLTFNRGFVLIDAPLAVTAHFVRIAAHAVADNPRTAAFAVVTNCGRAATALPVTANNSVGATHTAAVGIVLATAHAIRAGSTTALPVAVDMAGRAAEAIDADLFGVAAVRSANGFMGRALCRFFRRLSAKSSSPQAKRRQYCATDGATDHAQHFAP